MGKSHLKNHLQTLTSKKYIYESEHVHTATKRLRLILDTKYENADLHKVIGNQCQHLTMTQRNELLKL